MMSWRPGLLALLAVSLPAQSASAQEAALRLVSVIDAASRQPVAGVELRRVRTGATWRTSDEGIARIALPVGTHDFEIRRLGFAPTERSLDVLRPDTAAVSWELRAEMPVLPSVRVKAEGSSALDLLLTRNGFFERREGSGAPRSAFWTVEDLEHFRLKSWSELAARVSGARAVGSEDLALRCGLPLVVLDGVPQRGRRLRDIPLTDVAGIELYGSAAQVPVQYSRTSATGPANGCVALVWTRPSQTY